MFLKVSSFLDGLCSKASCSFVYSLVFLFFFLRKIFLFVVYIFRRTVCRWLVYPKHNPTETFDGWFSGKSYFSIGRRVGGVWCAVQCLFFSWTPSFSVYAQNLSLSVSLASLWCRGLPSQLFLAVFGRDFKVLFLCTLFFSRCPFQCSLFRSYLLPIYWRYCSFHWNESVSKNNDFFVVLSKKKIRTSLNFSHKTYWINLI